VASKFSRSALAHALKLDTLQEPLLLALAKLQGNWTEALLMHAHRLRVRQTTSSPFCPAADLDTTVPEATQRAFAPTALELSDQAVNEGAELRGVYTSLKNLGCADLVPLAWDRAGTDSIVTPVGIVHALQFPPRCRDGSAQAYASHVLDAVTSVSSWDNTPVTVCLSKLLSTCIFAQEERSLLPSTCKQY
jgi:hypothetical protein